MTPNPDVVLHPNPILCPTAELHCPACGAEAVYWKPDYGRLDYVEAYPCECRWDLPQMPYSEQLMHLHHLWRTRIKTWERLGHDYRAMALRPYEFTPENTTVAPVLLGVGLHDRVFLHGPAGAGKTHLTVTAMVEIWRRGLTVEYWSELAFFERAQEYSRSDSDTKVKPGREGDVLILEDLGKNRPTPYAAQMLYDVLEFRSANNLGLIVTSNHTPREAAERMVLDTQNAAAVESRLRSGRVVELLGDDRRPGSAG